MIPLTYVTGAKVQVAQHIEGTNGMSGLNTVLRTVAVPNPGTGAITFVTSKD